MLEMESIQTPPGVVRRISASKLTLVAVVEANATTTTDSFDFA
jgi:hypothetical protein